MTELDTRNTLAPSEPHPAAYSALEYVRSLPIDELMQWLESFSSCAIENNRIGQICGETLRRVMDGEGVSDRYILGLAWQLRRLKEMKDGGE